MRAPIFFAHFSIKIEINLIWRYWNHTHFVYPKLRGSKWYFCDDTNNLNVTYKPQNKFTKPEEKMCLSSIPWWPTSIVASKIWLHSSLELPWSCSMRLPRRKELGFFSPFSFWQIQSLIHIEFTCVCFSPFGFFPVKWSFEIQSFRFRVSYITVDTNAKWQRADGFFYDLVNRPTQARRWKQR